MNLKTHNRFIRLLVFFVLSLFIICFASAEYYTWDCPNCGRINNTGNYCGTCAHPAPWLSEPADNIALPGDITGDNNIDLIDLIRLLKYLSGADIEINTAACDINGDGIVDLIDVIKLHKQLTIGR